MVPLVTLLGTLARLGTWDQAHAAGLAREGPRCGEAPEGNRLEVEGLPARGTTVDTRAALLPFELVLFLLARHGSLRGAFTRLVAWVRRHIV
jgi:hypothetical protein